MLIDDLLTESIVGLDVVNTAGAWRTMVRAIRNLGRPGISSMAIAAVDIALWDLKARLLDLSVDRLPGFVRELVTVYASGGFTSDSEARPCEQLAGRSEIAADVGAGDGGNRR